MIPPFGGRNGIAPWLAKFFAHGNGVALTPDRTSCPWWQAAAGKADTLLFVAGKIRFIRPEGTTGNWPSTGTTLFACGAQGGQALERAAGAGLGTLLRHGVDAVEHEHDDAPLAGEPFAGRHAIVPVGKTRR